MQSQPPKSPYQGDFEGFERDRVIDKCQLISIIHHSYRFSVVGFSLLADVRCLINIPITGTTSKAIRRMIR